jgi:hypothetical protein
MTEVGKVRRRIVMLTLAVSIFPTASACSGHTVPRASTHFCSIARRLNGQIIAMQSPAEPGVVRPTPTDAHRTLEELLPASPQEIRSSVSTLISAYGLAAAQTSARGVSDPRLARALAANDKLERYTHARCEL